MVVLPLLLSLLRMNLPQKIMVFAVTLLGKTLAAQRVGII